MEGTNLGREFTLLFCVPHSAHAAAALFRRLIFAGISNPLE